jgi:hypothetical protein
LRRRGFWDNLVGMFLEGGREGLEEGRLGERRGRRVGGIRRDEV